MSGENQEDMQVEGPRTNPETGTHEYTVRGEERSIGFSVIPEEPANAEAGWRVDIEGIPSPGIVREQPWPSVEAARDAALQVIRNIFTLERMQRDDQRRSASK